MVLDKDVVRRVLARHGRSRPSGGGPSWLTFLGNARDSLWSVDLFRGESASLQSHWVMVVLDQWGRRIVGLATAPGPLDGPAVCRLFNRATQGAGVPVRLSTDHDRLFTLFRWRVNLRILGIDEIKTLPYVPLSHPFVERLVGTLRRECLDETLFWATADLQRKLDDSRTTTTSTAATPALAGFLRWNGTEQLLGDRLRYARSAGAATVPDCFRRR